MPPPSYEIREEDTSLARELMEVSQDEELAKRVGVVPQDQLERMLSRLEIVRDAVARREGVRMAPVVLQKYSQILAEDPSTDLPILSLTQSPELQKLDRLAFFWRAEAARRMRAHLST